MMNHMTGTMDSERGWCQRTLGCLEIWVLSSWLSFLPSPVLNVNSMDEPGVAGGLDAVRVCSASREHGTPRLA